MTNSSAKPQWANLPKELLEVIGKRLDSRIDVYRFRAVCSSWRSSVSPSYKQSPGKLLKLPCIKADAFLTQVTICRLEFVDESSSSSSSGAWLTKVVESTKGEMQLLNPFSNRPIRTPPGMFPKLWNLLNFRLIELTKAYTLTRAGGCPVFGINKVVLFPNPALSNDSNEYGLLALLHEGKLGYWRFGDDKWTFVDQQNFHYDDIMLYKGQFYVVDRWGTVSWIDSSLTVIQYSPPLYGCGNQKKLVESCGDLYVVDRYLDEESRTWAEDDFDMNNDFYDLIRNYQRCRAKTVDFKVYKLDEEWGRWVDVRSLGDRIFVLGHECCFSVSAKEFAGCEGNCIFFTDPNDMDFRGEVSGYDVSIFNLSNGTIGKIVCIPGYHHIFCPSPNWLSSKPSFL